MSTGGGRTTNEALELGRLGFELFNAGELEAVFASVHPDIFVATDPRWPDGGEFHGVDEYRRFMEQFLEAFASVRFEEEREPEAIGEWALFRGSWIGPGVTSGIETPSPTFTAIMRLREGRIGEIRFFFDDAEAYDFARSNA